MKTYNTIFIFCFISMLASCGTLLNGSKVMLHDDKVKEPVDITVGKRYYNNVNLPYKIKVTSGYKPVTVSVTSELYEPYEFSIQKKFNAASLGNLLLFGLPGYVVDLATGCVMKPDQKDYYINMQRKTNDTSNQQIYILNNTNTYEQENQIGLDEIIIRWQIDSEPRGARVFWRVVSNVPNEVHNTNENYLMSTPYEETKSFSIKGLTYENSANVQIEIKVTKVGYEDQIKRFNVRQAIDQQEISAFFQLVPKN